MVGLRVVGGWGGGEGDNLSEGAVTVTGQLRGEK